MVPAEHPPRLPAPSLAHWGLEPALQEPLQQVLLLQEAERGEAGLAAARAEGLAGADTGGDGTGAELGRGREELGAGGKYRPGPLGWVRCHRHSGQAGAGLRLAPPGPSLLTCCRTRVLLLQGGVV